MTDRTRTGFDQDHNLAPRLLRLRSQLPVEDSNLDLRVQSAASVPIGPTGNKKAARRIATGGSLVREFTSRRGAPDVLVTAVHVLVPDHNCLPSGSLRQLWRTARSSVNAINRRCKSLQDLSVLSSNPHVDLRKTFATSFLDR